MKSISSGTLKKEQLWSRCERSHFYWIRSEQEPFFHFEILAPATKLKLPKICLGAKFWLRSAASVEMALYCGDRVCSDRNGVLRL